MSVWTSREMHNVYGDVQGISLEVAEVQFVTRQWRCSKRQPATVGNLELKTEHDEWAHVSLIGALLVALCVVCF